MQYPIPPGPVLGPAQGVFHGDHYIPATPEHVLWGELPCEADRPILTVRPGETVTIDTLSHEGLLEDQGRDPRAFFEAQGVPSSAVLPDAELVTREVPHDPQLVGPHVVTGPIRVEGAEPGDVLAITVLDLERRVPYGVVSNRHGRGALPEELPIGDRTFSVFSWVDDTDAARPVGVMPKAGPDANAILADPAHAQLAQRALAESGVARFPLRPFLGIMGVATEGSTRLHSVPPGNHGGNIDINLLTVGSTLYLPVRVEGALAYVGDPHFAQGDGEVSLTAMEASLRATVRLDVIPRTQAFERFGELAGPMVETAEFLVPTGMDRDLDEAVKICVRRAISLLTHRYGMDTPHAYAYLSAATDFNISQVVDQVKGVHARIRVADLEPDHTA